MSTQTEAEVVDNLATTAHDFISRVLIGTDAQVISTVVVDHGDGVEIIGCPWKDDAEKKAMLMKVAVEIGQKGARAWSLVSEAWTATQKPEDKGPFVRPMNRPDRKEMVFCLIGTGAEDVHFWSWEIIRGKDGKCEKLGSMCSNQLGMKSWMARILNAGIDFSRLYPNWDGIKP
jgi:hypothetical protein